MRTVTRIGHVAVVASMMAGCSRPPTRRVADYEHSYRQPILDLQGESFVDPGTLSLPEKIRKVGTYLVAIQMDSVPVVVFGSSDGALLGSFGHRGFGPADLSGLWDVQPVRGARDNAWLYDLAKRRLVLVNLTSSITARQMVPLRVVDLQYSSTLTGPTQLSNGDWVSPGFFKGGRLAVFDSLGEFHGLAGLAPPARAGIPMEIVQHGYQATVASSPDRPLVLADRYSDQLGFYSSDGTLLRTADRPFGFEPRYRVATMTDGRQVFEEGPDVVMGYVDAQATSGRVYGLFSGRGRDKNHVAAAGQMVHEFDWQGHLLHVYRLRHDALSIAVDEGNGYLYALTADRSPMIERYALPRINNPQLSLGD